jgi:hypothetical protein
MEILLDNDSELDFNDAFPSVPIIPVFSTGKNKNPQLSKKRTYSSQWAWADTEERYDKDISKGIKHTYKKDDFYYDINANGFRCDNFDTMDFTKKSIIYLGCSNTFGVGVPEADTWASMVHEMIQTEHNTTYNYINLSVPGAGLDWYLHFLPYFSKFNPVLILSATPDMSRMNLITPENNQIISLTVAGVTALKKNKTSTPLDTTYLRIAGMGDGFFEYKKQVIFANINSTAKIIGAKFYEECSLDMVLTREDETIGEIARDGAHPVRFHYKTFAKLMMNKIKENK